jgi:hypothetical protein
MTSRYQLTLKSAFILSHSKIVYFLRLEQKPLKYYSIPINNEHPLTLQMYIFIFLSANFILNLHLNLPFRIKNPGKKLLNLSFPIEYL